MAPGVSSAPAVWPPVSPQVVGDSGSLRGRRWADVADEVDAEEAALAELAARCSPPSKPSLTDFVAVAHRDLHQRGRGSRGGALKSPVWASASPPVCGGTPSVWCSPRWGVPPVQAGDDRVGLGHDLASERGSEGLVPPSPAMAVAEPGAVPPPCSAASAAQAGELDSFMGLAGLALVHRPIIPWRSQDERSRAGPTVASVRRPVGAWL
jgi:hypothetical protein